MKATAICVLLNGTLANTAKQCHPLDSLNLAFFSSGLQSVPISVYGSLQVSARWHGAALQVVLAFKLSLLTAGDFYAHLWFSAQGHPLKI